MSFSETLFLFFLALIIFGPKKLPEIARLVGKYMNQFRRASNEFRSQIEQEFALMETREQQTVRPPSSPPPGTASRIEATPVEAKEAANAPTSEVSSAVDTSAVDANDEPLFAINTAINTARNTASDTASSTSSHAAGNNGSAPSSPAAQEAAAPDPVTSSAPQESHV